MRLSRVRVEDVNILVEEQLHELGRLQELPLAAQDAGSLLRRVEHAAAQQGEDHHEGVLHTDTETYTRTHRKTQAHKRAKSQTHTTAVNTHTLTHPPWSESKTNVLVHVCIEGCFFKTVHNCDGAFNSVSKYSSQQILYG